MTNFQKRILTSIIILPLSIFFIAKGTDLNIGISVLFLPLIMLQMAILSLGVGIFISSLTAKYRDLTFAMTFLVQIWMYATPVVYPLSIIPDNYIILAILNPMTSIVESFRGIFLGVSSIQPFHIMISITITIIISGFNSLILKTSFSSFKFSGQLKFKPFD